MTEQILKIVNHGMWRGHHEWTVTIDGATGPAQVSARDVETELDAIAQALETYRNRRVFTAEERAAMHRANTAIAKELS